MQNNKKLLRIALFISINILFITCASAYHSGTSSSSFTDVNKSGIYKKYSENYLKKAQFYENKANNTESGAAASVYYKLSEKYKAMANEKLNMSKAFETGNKAMYNQASQQYKGLRNEMKQISKNKDKKLKSGYESKKYNSSISEKNKDAQIQTLKKQLLEIQGKLNSLESQ
jgi:hypothetical protein